MLTVAMQA